MRRIFANSHFAFFVAPPPLSLYPFRSISQTRYALTIRDSTKISWISNSASGVTVHFSASSLNAIMSSYTVTQFERIYPTSCFGHLHNIWQVTANNTDGLIGPELAIPGLQPGQEAILSHGWKPNAPNFYDALVNTIAVCLLARIIEYMPLPPPFGGYTPAPMAIPEVTGVVSKNVRNNNNIVTRNLIIEDAVAGNKPYPKQSIDLANAETVAHNFDIQLISERYINPHFSGDLSAVAYAVLRSPELYAHWVASGAQGHGFTAHPEDSSFVWGGSDELRLQNVWMNAGDRFPATLEFVLRDSVPIPNFSFTIHLRQFISDMPADTPAYGNISFLLNVRDTVGEDGQKPAGTGSTPILQQDFEVFPNPTSRVVYIRRAESGTRSDAAIELLGINGQVVQKTTLSAGVWITSMDLKGLPSGIYIIRIEAFDGNARRYKLILK